MNAASLSTSLQEAVPPLFVCSPAPQDGVRVRTPMLYPDGWPLWTCLCWREMAATLSPISAIHWDWLRLQSVSKKRTIKSKRH